ncbi:uncharacterized protein isoform X2 [Rhodnius prolixus]|uniref:uncharacterized protein isoform X2 n=1 Tax=Rhodnius prolixus TaxID=13249 RepID=UPI003D18BEFA
MNFWRKKKATEGREDFCQKFCKYCLLTIGVKKGQPWTILSIFVLITLIMSFLSWMYSLSETENQTHVLHYLSLHITAIGLFFIYIFKSDIIFDVAIEADNMFIYDDPVLKQIYKSFQKKYFGSWKKKYADFFTVLVFLVWANILYINMSLTLFTSTDIPPPFMKALIKSKVWIIALKRIRPSSNNLLLSSDIIDNVNTCIKHHQLIFRSFDKLKAFFSLAFPSIYFGMIWAIGICRTLLVGEHIDVIGLVPLFYLEMGNIHIFCYISDALREVCSKISFAAYSSEWLLFPKSALRSLNIIMIRTTKLPEINFFMGGSAVTCETFTLMINATLTFFIISFILQ